MRSSVLEDLESCIVVFNHPFMILSDFNQVEFESDKLSKNTRAISGAYDFNIWRVSNELVDIPFKGPRYTWCNNRKGDKRVYERIDQELGSKDWFSLFPNIATKHYHIQILDNAPIELDLNLTRNVSKKLYKMDAWVFSYEECIGLIKESWNFCLTGTPVYIVARKLARVRSQVKKWAFDKRQEWRQKWDNFDIKLEQGMYIAIKEGNNEFYTKTNEEIIEFSKAVAIVWRQRAKIKWMVEGDTCTKYFFNWVKGRAGRNFILGVKDHDGEWVYDPMKVGNMSLTSFIELYNPERRHEGSAFSAEFRSGFKGSSG
ncbi:uncharacterized protein LOC141631545 [Silene latifolia]|uniref:uncharacterized protein LOC141631545 n=1 Tax=Silene latifolia TaxID=37657 RepID=UPI003D77B43C